MSIVLIGADVGCLEVLLPLRIALRDRCATLLCLAEGSRARLGDASGLIDEVELDRLIAREETLQVVATTPGKAQAFVSRTVQRAADGGARTALIETVYLSARSAGLRDLRPDPLVTIDDFALGLYRELGLPLPPTRIAALGHPAFDRIAGKVAAVARQRKALRERIGIGAEVKAIGFFAPSARQAEPGFVLGALRQVIAECPDAVLLHFPHPADPRPAEILRKARIVVLGGISLSEPERLAISDVAVTQFSTLGSKAIHCGHPNRVRRLRQERALPRGERPVGLSGSSRRERMRGDRPIRRRDRDRGHAPLAGRGACQRDERAPARTLPGVRPLGGADRRGCSRRRFKTDGKPALSVDLMLTLSKYKGD